MSGGEVDPRESRFPFGFGGLAGGDLAGEVAADGSEHFLKRIGGNVVDINVVSRHGADMGNAAAHLSRADDAHTLDLVAHWSRLTDLGCCRVH
jgi:hypothetical protein